MDTDTGAGDAVAEARIDHRLKRDGGRLELGHQRGRVVEHHIVVGHAVDDEQRVFDRRGVRQRVRRLIRLGIGCRIAEIALRIMRVVQVPAGNRRP